MTPPTACSNLVMALLRRAVIDLVEHALVDSGVTPDLRDRFVDRGDWLIVLVHPTDRIPKTWLLTRLVPRLKALLDERNAGQDHPLRLRLVIHPGDVACDDFGWFGEDIDIATRLLTASTHEQATAPLVLVVSEPIHRSVIRHGYDGVDDWVFVPLPRVEVAGEECKGWVHVPDEV
ncbi:hypothetical protein AB0A63_19190 [Lentzea sp. NPDC042327]|uniref:hypothetical protein n=1 Tax=Lentzea sp. NPDC042327 TaxID=3154801 RepID=UPI0033FA97DA